MQNTINLNLNKDQTKCYIITPNRCKSPVFEIFGTEEKIKATKSLIYTHLLENLSAGERLLLNEWKQKELNDVFVETEHTKFESPLAPDSNNVNMKILRNFQHQAPQTFQNDSKHPAAFNNFHPSNNSFVNSEDFTPNQNIGFKKATPTAPISANFDKKLVESIISILKSNPVQAPGVVEQAPPVKSPCSNYNDFSDSKNDLKFFDEIFSKLGI